MRIKLILAASIAVVVALALAASAPAGFGPHLDKGNIGDRTLSSKRVSISGTDNFQRFQVYCPRGERPLGGGLHTDPAPDGRGGGVFPTSYERLGEQEGWHNSVSQVHRSGTTSVTVQVLCARYRGNIDPQEKFIKSRTYKNMSPGETKRFTETCPHGTQLVTGGYLTGQLFDNKGVFVSESRMEGGRSWTVLAHAIAGGNGGQVSSIAYCIHTKHPLLTEVAGPAASVRAGGTATSTVPPCPGKTRLIAGGFSAPPSVEVFDGGFSGRDSWSASGSSYAGAGTVTALGYCL